MYSSIFKKFLMALSGVFLMLFLLQHLFINLTSLIPDDGLLFNKISHFMGYNPIVQFLLQPILLLGVCFHFVMGFILEFQNYTSRNKKYIKYSVDSSWGSKNMIITGLVILSFLGLHFYDFWVPEIDYKYINNYVLDESRYFDELKHQFHGNSIRTSIYCFSFILLGLHLYHGFSSSFQSMGLNFNRTNTLQKIGLFYSLFISIGFIAIALFHYFIE